MKAAVVVLAGALAIPAGCDRLDLPSAQRLPTMAVTASQASDAGERHRLLVRRTAAPQLPLQADGGETVTLDHFAGRVVVLALWASDCEPCRSNLSSLERLAERMPAVAIVPVELAGLDAMVEASCGMAERVPGRLASYRDPSGRIGQLLGARALPASFLIDRQGRVAAIVDGAADWTSPAMLALLLRV